MSDMSSKELDSYHAKDSYHRKVGDDDYVDSMHGMARAAIHMAKQNGQNSTKLRKHTHSSEGIHGRIVDRLKNDGFKAKEHDDHIAISW